MERLENHRIVHSRMAGQYTHKMSVFTFMMTIVILNQNIDLKRFNIYVIVILVFGNKWTIIVYIYAMRV